MYLEKLEANYYSIHYRNRVKLAVSSFARWLIKKDLLQQNPAHGVEIPSQPLLAPRELHQGQKLKLLKGVEEQ
ncbi:MAG TPA: hypothetical protein VK073_04785 [Pseudogracilibacillus sp.]|nr:hypothetical protein [Pseudogracilibacillus sp.]